MFSKRDSVNDEVEVMMIGIMNDATKCVHVWKEMEKISSDLPSGSQHQEKTRIIYLGTFFEKEEKWLKICRVLT